MPSHSTRTIPLALAAAEIILTVPRPISQGGNGFDALRATATGGTTTTVTFAAGNVAWSDFEAGAVALADRFNGLKIRINSVERICTDYVAGTLTFAPAAATVVAGDALEIASDLPAFVSTVTIFNPAAASATVNVILYNTMNQAGLITAGQSMSITGQAERNIIEDFSGYGTATYPIRVANTHAAQSMNLTIAAP